MNSNILQVTCITMRHFRSIKLKSAILQEIHICFDTFFEAAGYQRPDATYRDKIALFLPRWVLVIDFYIFHQTGCCQTVLVTISFPPFWRCRTQREHSVRDVVLKSGVIMATIFIVVTSDSSLDRRQRRFKQAQKLCCQIIKTASPVKQKKKYSCQWYWWGGWVIKLPLKLMKIFEIRMFGLEFNEFNICIFFSQKITDFSHLFCYKK